jgi:hypothetical protein
MDNCIPRENIGSQDFGTIDKDISTADLDR